MAGYVYILLSQKDHKTYTGSTDNLERRLIEHHKGYVNSTRDRLPIKIIHKEEFESITEARKKEKYYKSCAGRKKLKEILKEVI